MGTPSTTTVLERILLVAGELVAERGLPIPTGELAERVGVSRMTVHRHVGDRDQLLVALVLHELGEEVAPRLVSVLDDTSVPFPERVAEAMARAVEAVQASPVLRALVERATPTEIESSDPGWTLPKAIRAFFEPWFLDGDNRAQLAHDPHRCLDHTLRQLLLHLVVRGEGWTGIDDVRDDLATFFVPSIARRPTAPQP